MNGAVEICPGGHIGGVAVPITGFLNRSVIDGVNCFIAVIFEAIEREIGRNIIATIGKTGDLPLPVRHGLYNQVFLDIFNGFLTTCKDQKECC